MRDGETRRLSISASRVDATSGMDDRLVELHRKTRPYRVYGKIIARTVNRQVYTCSTSTRMWNNVVQVLVDLAQFNLGEMLAQPCVDRMNKHSDLMLQETIVRFMPNGIKSRV